MADTRDQQEYRNECEWKSNDDLLDAYDYYRTLDLPEGETAWQLSVLRDVILERMQGN